MSDPAKYKEVWDMTGINGISAYQQINRNIEVKTQGYDRSGEVSRAGANKVSGQNTSNTSKIETTAWSPIDTASSLVPRVTEYGNTIGDVKLSDAAKEYYEKLKSKFHNMEFIAVSGDMKSQVQKNAASYGNANKTVVLIDAEKLERMATDESFRKKYEGIIEMSQTKLADMKNSLAGSGAAIKNFGMSVDENGKESFFATVEKSQDLQKKRIEKKAAEKKQLKAKEQKEAAKQAQEERIEKARADRKAQMEKYTDGEDEAEEIDEREYVKIEADSLEDLLSKVQSYSYDRASARVLTEAERNVGTQIDFKG